MVVGDAVTPCGSMSLAEQVLFEALFPLAASVPVLFDQGGRAGDETV